MPEIIITCVSDNSEFPKEVYDYLLSELERHKQHKKGKDMQVSKDLLVLKNSEILIGSDTRVSKEIVKWILQSFLKSDPSRFKDYEVVELADTFTIGRVLHPSKMEMYTCEICGYFTPYFEELHTHRVTHFGV